MSTQALAPQHATTLTGASEYATIHVPVPEGIALCVRRAAAMLITPDQLYPEEGLEDQPHVTCLYGIETNSPDAAVLALVDVAPFGVTLHRVGMFRDAQQPYDVLFLHISAPALFEIRTRLEQLPHTTTHPTYVPHLTLGYVKKGLVDPDSLRSVHTGCEGMTWECKALEFVSPGGVCTRIPLPPPEDLIHDEADEAQYKATAVTLEALSMIVPDVVSHPNRLPFEGILTRVGEPSDKSPGGGRGHRVLIPHAVAEAALPSLIGMAVGMTRSLDDHDRRFKVGIITAADIIGNDLVVKGFLYARDFPQEVALIRQQSQAGRLGMSFEITDVAVRDPDQPVWSVEHLTFTGAAILQWAKAAYHKTRLVAASGGSMSDTDTATIDVAATIADIQKLQASMEQLFGMRERLDALCHTMGRMHDMKAMMQDAVDSMSRYATMAYGMSLNMAKGTEAKTESDKTSSEDAAPQAEQPVLQALEKLQATMEGLVTSISSRLITDNQATSKGLATDSNTRPAGGLKTDFSAQQADPQRKTVQAANDYQEHKTQYAGKLEGDGLNANAVSAHYVAELRACGLEAGKKYTYQEVDAAIRANRPDMTTQERMVFKNDMVVNGQLD